MSAGTFYENFFSKERHSLFFPILSDFFTSSENFRKICETRNLGTVEVFGEKHICNLYVLPHFFEVWSKKRLVGKFVPVCLNCNPRVQRHFLRKSNFLLKNVKIAQLFRNLRNFACLLTKKVRVSRKQPTNTEKNGGKSLWKNRFFKSFPDSEQKILNSYTKKTRRIVKTTFYVSKGTLKEQHFRKEVLKTSGFSENFWNFRDNGGKFFSGLAKHQ